MLIDREEGLKLSYNSKELYNEIISAYIDESEQNIANLTRFLNEKNWREYTVIAHAIKSNSKQIGANALYEESLKMEMAGKSKDEYYIVANHDSFMKHYHEVLIELQSGTNESIENHSIDATINKGEEHEHIVNSLSKMFYAVYHVNLETLAVTQVSAPKSVQSILENANTLGAVLDKMNEYLVAKESRDSMRVFNDYSKWKDLLSDKDTISMEFLGEHEGWSRANIVVSWRNENKEAVEIVYAIQQTDDQKRREETILANLKDALSMAEKASHAKSMFLSNISHDIRTPMNAIVNYTQLAISQKENPPKTGEYLSHMLKASHYLMSLINSLLDMSKIESGKIQINEISCNIKELVTELKNMVYIDVQAKKQTFEINVDDIINENVMCDSLRFNQVMINILTNAVKYTGDEGMVSVIAKEEPNGLSGQSMYHFLVKDSGVGIDKEFIKHIFTPFERESNTTMSGIQGTGLGLAISKTLVEAMGGNISIKSKKGAGTEVYIDIVFRHADNHSNKGLSGHLSKKEKESSVHVNLKDLGILLVEDNSINRLIVSELLSDRVKFIEEATNGKEAVDMISGQDSGHYSLILMDIQMPVMDGYEAAKAIRSMDDKKKANIPIIAVSANAFEEDKRDALNAGMDSHVSKPIDIDILTEAIQDALEKNNKT